MTNNIVRPDAVATSGSDTQTQDPSRFEGLPAVYLYLNLSPEMLRTLRTLVPKWLWDKRVENSATAGRKMENNNKPLFKGKAVEGYFAVEDLINNKFLPCHIHIMVREHGGARVRVAFYPTEYIVDKSVLLEKEQLMWVLMMLERFVWDGQAHSNPNGTEHLPPHVAIGLANPTERSDATTVQSIQVVNGSLSLITDPDAVQSAARR